MAGGIVHDFNNALMSVIGYTEILLSDEELLRDTSTARQYLTIMNTAGQDASHLISRLRDFYRPREVTDVFARVDLNEVVEQAVSLIQPKWKGQALAEGRTICVELDLAHVPAVLGNAAELREVLTNLIFNAVDAMPQGGRIKFATAHADGDVLIEAIDSGMGMTPQVRSRCLEPFFSTKGHKGTGLGLSMVFGIIKRHEGTVEIESEVGTGTTFRIRLPPQVRPMSAERDTAAKLSRALRVLVVDDEPVSRAVLQHYLAADGHVVVTAADAEAAMHSVADGSFDLLITDHAMPGMNGVQLAGAVREVRADFPVILITGFPDGGREWKESAAKIDFVIQKPVPRRELRQALMSVMG